MITYPINNVQSVPDNQTGRILIISDAISLTPNMFYKYIKEGFVPVAVSVENDTASYEFCSYSTKIGDEETYTITAGSKTYTSAPVDGVPAWDIPYSAE